MLSTFCYSVCYYRDSMDTVYLKLHWCVFLPLSPLSVLCVVLPQLALPTMVNSTANHNQVTSISVCLVPRPTVTHTHTHTLIGTQTLHCVVKRSGILGTTLIVIAKHEILFIICRAFVLLVIEYCWNVFPSTIMSSLLLHSAHALILTVLFMKECKSAQTLTTKQE